jgi:hypothetical protein
VLAALAMAASASVFSAESHYRWTDAQGNPVHSDRPPPKGMEYEVVSSGSTLVRKVSGQEGAVPAEVEPSVSNDFDQTDTQPLKVVKNSEFCKRAQENLDTLDSVARIRIRNDNGDYRFLDEEEKEAQREEARRQIAIHC